MHPICCLYTNKQLFLLLILDALQRTNATMRQQYTMVNDWHNCVKGLKENHDKELKKFRTINDEVSKRFCLI